jgi:hypothetical protein
MSEAFSDYIVYVDESGDPNLSNINPVFPMFCLSFCVVEKSNYVSSIVPSFQNFKFKYFGHDLVVLHEHEIRKSKGKFTLLLTNSELRQQFYSDLTQLMTDADMNVIAGVIRKSALVKSYKDPYDPYRLALLFCMEKLLSYLLAKGQKDKIVDVIFESRGRNEDRELEVVFRRICDNQEGWGFKSFDFRQCDFRPVFAPKTCNSTGLQLADLTARPIALKTLRPDQENRAYEIIERKLEKKVFP